MSLFLLIYYSSLIIDVFSPLVSQPLQHALDRLKVKTGTDIIKFNDSAHCRIYSGC